MHRHLPAGPSPLPRLRDLTQHKHHPWRVFSTLTEWRLRWTSDLPTGVLGLTLHDERLVLMADDLDQAERRCTIAHETQHILRGPTPRDRRMREELIVDRRVARLLAPSVRRLGHALAFHGPQAEHVADELWIDEATLDVRLASLTKREKAYVDEQLATVWL